jgi:Uma2 family endonuclease
LENEMATVLPASSPGSIDSDLPLILPGDHLDRETFHARYARMPEEVRAELVGGVVYMSPLYPPHGRAHAEVIYWLGHYRAATAGLDLLDNTSVHLLDDGEPQPDACLVLPASHGGRTREEADCIAGAPELVVEVAYSSDAYDLHSKKRDYERAGVREYLVVLLRERRVVWFALRGDRYQELAPGEDGLLRSEVFPGLWLAPDALLRRDTSAVRTVLEQGLASPEHAEFVRWLDGPAA